MINSLTIKNYALIDHLAVDLGSGFTVITGETGAGKSIILGALGLLLGQRADLESIKDKTVKSVIEGHFDLSRFDLREFFESHDLDFDNQTIIRRELLPSGKSRAFVNDTPVKLAVLSTLGDQIIDIHSQLQQLAVNTTAFKFHLVDLVAGNNELLQDYRLAFTDHNKAAKALKLLQEDQAQAEKEYDYNIYLLDELQALPLDKLDEAQLDQEYETLSNVERIQELLAEVLNSLADEQVGAGNQLRAAVSSLAHLAKISPQFQQQFERLQSLQIELEDIEASLFESQEEIEHNPSRLAELEGLTRSLYDLKRKHAAATVAELIIQRDELAAKVSLVADQSESLEKAQQSKEVAFKKMKNLAGELRAKRKGVLVDLCESVNEYLRQLEMPNAQFEIRQLPEESFNEFGAEQLEFYFTANKGVAPGPLQKVASGGELSRVMLALKAIMAKHTNLATLIFDEIDTGVSGEVANRMGQIMAQMAHSMQLICITHLPQVAAKGTHHFKVYKEVSDTGTVTQIKSLSPDERIVEIAQMLGGQQLSETALNHAKELLN